MKYKFKAKGHLPRRIGHTLLPVFLELRRLENVPESLTMAILRKLNFFHQTFNSDEWIRFISSVMFANKIKDDVIVDSFDIAKIDEADCFQFEEIITPAFEMFACPCGDMVLLADAKLMPLLKFFSRTQNSPVYLKERSTPTEEKIQIALSRENDIVSIYLCEQHYKLVNNNQPLATPYAIQRRRDLILHNEVKHVQLCLDPLISKMMKSGTHSITMR